MKKLSVLACAVLLAGCAKNIQNEGAVKAGVMDYLNQRSADTGLNMGAMDVTVGSLSFEKDTARANVSFHPKGMPAGAGMARAYVLNRQGDKWVVDAKASGAVTMQMPDGTQQSMPAGGSMPAGHPSTDGGAGALPPGHPPAGGATGGAAGGALPPGHPPMGSKK
ncbi:MAG: hypothetical protein ABL967_04730 [Bryobacteraceae bacterium]